MMKIRNDIKSENILKHVETLCSFGIAWAGSETERKRAEYVENIFKKHGLETKTEKFKARCFEEKRCNLALIEPEKKNVESVALMFSPSTPAQGITGKLVDVVYGRKEDYEGKDVNDKIVLIRMSTFERMQTDFSQEAKTASEKGAKGLIIVNNMPNPRRMGLWRERGCIPAVCVSSMDGEYLLSKGLKATMRIEAEDEERETVILRGMINGAESPEDRVLLVAHLDTVVPGANDNTAACGIITELAKVMSHCKPKRTIEFVLWGGHETGRFGSKTYIELHRDELRNIIGVINLDCVGGTGPLKVLEESWYKDGKTVKTSERLNNLIIESAKELGFKMVYLTKGFPWNSDEERFIDEGVDATWIEKGSHPHAHSPTDTPETLNPLSLKIVADVCFTTILKLVNEGSIRSHIFIKK